jgi:transposase
MSEESLTIISYTFWHISMNNQGGYYERSEKLPVKIGLAHFNKYVKPCLSRARRGPKAKLSQYEVFNYVLYVLHTGIQWNKLPIKRNKVHWTQVYKWHLRWSKDGSYKDLFETSVGILNKEHLLDLSLLHGDGSNTIAKKGVKELATQVINTRKG